jgi:RNA-directed DNA polymerase
LLPAGVISPFPLGFNIRRYRNGKLLIKPGKAAVWRVKRTLAADAPPARAGRIRRLRRDLPPPTRWPAHGDRRRG